MRQCARERKLDDSQSDAKARPAYVADVAGSETESAISWAAEVEVLPWTARIVTSVLAKVHSSGWVLRLVAAQHHIVSPQWQQTALATVPSAALRLWKICGEQADWMYVAGMVRIQPGATGRMMVARHID